MRDHTILGRWEPKTFSLEGQLEQQGGNRCSSTDIYSAKQQVSQGNNPTLPPYPSSLLLPTKNWIVVLLKGNHLSLFNCCFSLDEVQRSF